MVKAARQRFEFEFWVSQQQQSDEPQHQVQVYHSPSSLESTTTKSLTTVILKITVFGTHIQLQQCRCFGKSSTGTEISA